MSLPVSPASYIYSHFRHVSGTPAPEGVQGVAITKLKIIDTLIEQLTRMKKRPETSFGPEGPVSEERIDALIEQLENQIRSTQATSAAIPYTPAVTAPAPGALVTLVA
jgi:hypothetical protein